jgi:hypothetical protein
MAIPNAGHLHSLFRANSPSDAPEDLSDLAVAEEAAVLGVETTQTYGFRINYKSLVITGIVFMLIVAWFDFVQTAFYFWYRPNIDPTDIGPAGVFWFCLFATILGGLIILALTLW